MNEELWKDYPMDEVFLPDEEWRKFETENFHFVKQKDTGGRLSIVYFLFKKTKIKFQICQDEINYFSIRYYPERLIADDVPEIEGFVLKMIEKFSSKPKYRVRSIVGKNHFVMDNKWIYSSDDGAWSLFELPQSNVGPYFLNNKENNMIFNPDHSSIPRDLKEKYKEYIKSKVK